MARTVGIGVALLTWTVVVFLLAKENKASWEGGEQGLILLIAPMLWMVGVVLGIAVMLVANRIRRGRT